MSDINTIQPNESVESTDAHIQSPPSSNSYRDMNFISLKGFFGIDSPEAGEEEALNWIYGEFEKMGSTDMSEILLGIRDIERRITSPVGTPRVTAVRNYLKINSQIADLEGQKQAMTL